MFIKTSSIIAKEYLEVVHHPNFDSGYVFNVEVVFSKETNYLVQYDHDVFAENIEGLATIVVTEDPETKPAMFVLQNLVRIRKGLYFSFVCNSKNPIVKIYVPKQAKFKAINLRPKLSLNIIKSNFSITEIYTIFYLSKNTDYYAQNNTHNFYEITYLDSGCLDAIIDGESVPLTENDIVLIAPYQKHSFKATEKVTFISIMFTMEKDNVDKIINKSFHCNDRMIEIIQKIHQASDVQNQYYCEILINYLKELIILMEFQEEIANNDIPIIMPKQRYEDEMINEIVNYVENNIYTAIDVEEICNRFGISRTTLQNLFKENLNTTPKLYINNEKMRIAKTLLKTRRKTVSEVSDALGYTSIHYFSRKFKTIFGISPSDYAKKPD